MLADFSFQQPAGAGFRKRVRDLGAAQAGLEKASGIVNLEHLQADDKKAIASEPFSTFGPISEIGGHGDSGEPRCRRKAMAADGYQGFFGLHGREIYRQMTIAMQLPEPVEGYIHLSEGKLHYLDWGGDGPQMHFLHANGFCAGTYSPFLRHLTGLYRVIASDVRGHGDSTFPAAERIRHWNVFADDLKAIVEGAMAPPVLGMGHSLGAVTTCIAAARYPLLFSAIILLDPVFLVAGARWRHALMRMLGLRNRLPLARTARKRKRSFAGKQSALKRFVAGRGIFKSWSADFIEAYMECGLLEPDADTAILRCDPELEAQIFESVPLDVWNSVSRVQCPILAIRGEHSDTFLAEAGRKLERIAADAQVKVIAQAGHFFPMEKPEETAAAIAEFIGRNLPEDQRASNRSPLC